MFVIFRLLHAECPSCCWADTVKAQTADPCMGKLATCIVLSLSVILTYFVSSGTTTQSINQWENYQLASLFHYHFVCFSGLFWRVVYFLTSCWVMTSVVEVFVVVLPVPDEVDSMTFVDVTDTSFVVIWTSPYFTNGILTGMSVATSTHSYKFSVCNAGQVLLAVLWFCSCCHSERFAFNALMLLVGRQEGYPACWGAGVVVCLEQGADLHMAQLMPQSLASVKSRLVLLFCTGSPG